eukprot:15462403-Alexandrium_andersonii.AAC.1
MKQSFQMDGAEQVPGDSCRRLRAAFPVREEPVASMAGEDGPVVVKLLEAFVPTDPDSEHPCSVGVSLKGVRRGFEAVEQPGHCT